jgi:hypothetical protein
LKDPLLRLIAVVDQCNHAVKQGDWHQTDLETFYGMKDELMERLYKKPPKGVEVRLTMVPYLRRCTNCKDKAGAAMRSDPDSKGFEHYLEMIPPCGNDYDDPDRATLEMEVKYLGRIFCFHIPLRQAQDWGVDSSLLERKQWIPSKEFNHIRFAPVFDEIRALLGILK